MDEQDVARYRARTSNHLRRTKLVAAVSVSLLAGVGSYAASYRALDLVARPVPAVGSVAPLPSAGPGSAPVDTPPTQPLP